MNVTSRDKWLLAFLPIFLGLVIYETAVARPARVAIEAQKRALAAHGTSEERRTMLALATAEQARLRKDVEEKRTKLAVSGIKFNRGRALPAISQLCADRQLAVVASAPETEARLPQRFAAMAAVVAPADEMAPRLWRLELRGSYGAVAGLLDAVGKLPILVVPLQVAMKMGEDERQPLSWTITLFL